MNHHLKLFVFLLASSLAYTGSAQTNPMGSVQGQGNMTNAPRGVMNEVKKPERAVVGNTYWNENWFPGKITFNDGQVLVEKPLRYDIQADVIEVKLDDKLMGVQGKNVKSFSLYNASTQTYDVYVNAGVYKENEIAQTGFFRVITQGEWSLFEKMQVSFVQSSYNPVLGVGNEEPRYVKKTELYIAHGTAVFEVPNSKGKLLKSIDQPTENLSAFMKENDLSVKDAKDLKSIVEFLNSKG